MTGTSDIPTSFGFPTFLRIFIPGISGSVLLYYSISFLIPSDWFDIDVDKLLFFLLLVGTILGVILTSADFYIYQFYEGFRFWPNSLLKRIHNRIFLDFLRKSGSLLKLEEKDQLTLAQENEKSKLLYDLRENPYLPEKEFIMGRYPSRPTRLGNVMAEYESYSKKQYGMNMSMFWHQLWLIVPNDVRDFLDLKAAISDFLIYTSFIFLIFAPLFGFSIAYKVYSMRSTLSMPHPIALSALILILIFIVSLICSYILYRLAVNAIKIYGNSVKALFDIYRFDLAEKLGIEIKLVPGQEDMEKWQNLGYFFLDYERSDEKQFPNEIPIEKRKRNQGINSP